MNLEEIEKLIGTNCEFCVERNDNPINKSVIVIIHLEGKIEALCEDDAKTVLQLIKYIHSTPRSIFLEGKWTHYIEEEVN